MPTFGKRKYNFFIAEHNFLATKKFFFCQVTTDSKKVTTFA